MRKWQKTQVFDMVKKISEAHNTIKSNLENRAPEAVSDLLVLCQDTAINAGNLIEASEGEGFITVSCLEEYCEILFSVYKEIQAETEINPNKTYKKLNRALIKAENSIRNDINVRREAVFLPYKASMWDSLASIWEAANADPDCDAYVIPIPYFDKNNDGTFREMHYERDLYPESVPITKYDEFDFGEHRPDMVFIHNPYDNNNFVTSIHPFFYSDNIKKYTDCLCYVPYYATAGGMSEAQRSCPAYYNADYIVIQSEKHRNFFDAQIPDKKFLPLGSPKFDAVIKKCQNPPETPDEWKFKIYDNNGNKKKVYFYNTSIGGMLGNTEKFLKKMEYVFDTFKGRDDACLIWRPHPLLESTFDSMRPQYRKRYEEIKKKYIEDSIGIYDTTPMIEDTIANSDVYIGDAGTSVTSLFGVTGKPLFILDNGISSLPCDDTWRHVFIHPIWGNGNNRYALLYGKELFFSPENDLRFRYLCSIPDDSVDEGDYQRALEYKDKVFLIPQNAQDIIVMDGVNKFRKIHLRKEVAQGGAFAGFMYHIDMPEYIFLQPLKYPDMVRINLDTERVDYIQGIRDFNIAEVDGQTVCAAKWIVDDKVCVLNPQGTTVLSIDIRTLKISKQSVDFNRLLIGACAEEDYGDLLWLLPYSGTVVTRWDKATGMKRDYDLHIEGMEAVDRQFKIPTTKYMIGGMAFFDGKVIFSPNWANKFVELDPESGIKKEWESPFITSAEDQNDYYPNYGVGGFIRETDNPDKYTYYSAPVRKAYWIDLETKEIRERKESFDVSELMEHEPGFARRPRWLQYGCKEGIFNTLPQMLDGNICGRQFDREQQIRCFMDVNASPDGDCGDKVYKFLTKGNEK